MGYLPCQLVQDFFHQPYQFNISKWLHFQSNITPPIERPRHAVEWVGWDPIGVFDMYTRQFRKGIRAPKWPKHIQFKLRFFSINYPRCIMMYHLYWVTILMKHGPDVVLRSGLSITILRGRGYHMDQNLGCLLYL